nr:hypothetical protein [Angustibacter aerolatus]
MREPDLERRAAGGHRSARLDAGRGPAACARAWSSAAPSRSLADQFEVTVPVVALKAAGMGLAAPSEAEVG